ncbi:MAG: sugar ABC transporter permease [Treponema sp.]|jgi:multiple sugar transport system permease protein|nr:sugar ABC transporter permease [Treponema sp.]
MTAAARSAGTKRRGLPSYGMYMVIPVLSVTVLFYGVFLIFPIGYAFLGSLFEWNPIHSVFNFLFLENYREAFEYSLTWTSLFNSIYFAVVVVAVRTFIGLVFAVLINNVVHLRSFFRTVYFLPVVTSMVAVSILWGTLLYNPAFGMFNQILIALGLPPSEWIKSPYTAMLSVMLMTIWKDTGYALVLYLAGLQGIPSQLIEAATIDGAGRMKIFTRITFPLLSSTTLLVAVTGTISYLQAFTQIFIMTEGGPGTATYTMVYYLYHEAFRKFRFGYASAVSVILFVIILVFSLIQMKLTRRED